VPPTIDYDGDMRMTPLKKADTMLWQYYRIGIDLFFRHGLGDF